MSSTPGLNNRNRDHLENGYKSRWYTAFISLRLSLCDFREAKNRKLAIGIPPVVVKIEPCKIAVVPLSGTLRFKCPLYSTVTQSRASTLFTTENAHTQLNKKSLRHFVAFKYENTRLENNVKRTIWCRTIKELEICRLIKKCKCRTCSEKPAPEWQKRHTDSRSVNSCRCTLKTSQLRH